MAIMVRFISLSNIFALLAVAISAPIWSANAQECPPPGLAPLVLDLESFASAPFFAVKGVQVLFFDPNANFCLRQTFTFREPQAICGILPFLCLPTFEGQVTIDLFNSANLGSVNGPLIPNPLIAVSDDPAGAASFRQGPQFVPQIAFQEFTVVAAGTFADLLDDTVTLADLAAQPTSTVYDWAIIPGGIPDVSTGNGCLPGVGALNPDGVLLVSRDPTPGDEIINRIEEVAEFIGIDTSVLLPVVQEGCTYPPL